MRGLSRVLSTGSPFSKIYPSPPFVTLHFSGSVASRCVLLTFSIYKPRVTLHFNTFLGQRHARNFHEYPPSTLVTRDLIYE